MKPDRTYYESWIIDYIEGTLDSGREKELLEFLKNNPDINEEFSDIMKMRIEAGGERFGKKESLRRSAADLPDDQFGMLCVAAMEGDLSEEHLHEFNEMISSDRSRKDTAESIFRLRLKPPDISFRNKSRLKRLTLPQKRMLIISAVSSVAASVVLMITVFTTPGNTGNNLSGLDLRADTSAAAAVQYHDKDSVKMVTDPVEKAPDLNTEPAGKTLLAQSREPVNNTPVSPDIQVLSVPDSLVMQRTMEISGLKKSEYRNPALPSVDVSGLVLAAVDISEPAIPLYDTETGRIPLNIAFATFFREKILKDKSAEKGSLRAYEIADAGITGINRLLGWDMKLEKKTDDKGTVNSVYFNSRLLKFNAPVKKSESLE